MKKMRLKLTNIFLKLRRFINRKNMYYYSQVNDNWSKNDYPVICKNGDTYFDPCVLYDNKKFYLYASKRKTGAIVRFESIDGITWDKEIEVLTGTKNTWEEIVNRACVIKKEEKYYMWYTGQFKNKSKIGYATSEDGVKFKKNNSPVLIPSECFEQESIMNPCVIFDNEEKKYKMWYSAGEQYEPDFLCYATSEDGIEWDKYNINPIFKKGKDRYDKFKVGGCDVKKINQKYLMFYIGYQNIDVARICMASSLDGIIWNRSKSNPIISPTKNSWDAHSVYKPTFYYNKINNKIMLWYNGRKNGDEFIGYAWTNCEL